MFTHTIIYFSGTSHIKVFIHCILLYAEVVRLIVKKLAVVITDLENYAFYKIVACKG